MRQSCSNTIASWCLCMLEHASVRRARLRAGRVTLWRRPRAAERDHAREQRISPWARRHYVSHVQHEHTSVLRFIETLFDLPALTARDANSDALLDMFDFGHAPADVPDAPASGTGGCK